MLLITGVLLMACIPRRCLAQNGKADREFEFGKSNSQVREEAGWQGRSNGDEQSRSCAHRRTHATCVCVCLQWVINGRTWSTGRLAATVGTNRWEVWKLKTGGERPAARRGGPTAPADLERPV